MPLVAGTVANQRSPNEIPKAMAEILDGGKNINSIIEIALKKYNPAKSIFLLYLSLKYPIIKTPTILNKPISARIAKPVQSSKPRSCTYLGT